MLAIDIPVGLAFDLDIDIRNFLFDNSDRVSDFIIGKIRYIWNDSNETIFEKAKMELTNNNIKYEVTKWK